AGSGNTAVGLQSLRNSLGSNNTAIGWQSAYTNAAGANNTALGYQSLFTNATGTNNVSIGYQAGYFETGSNKLYIENSNANAVNALIYGEFDNNIVRVNGQLQVADPTTTGYKFPLARGTNKQTLETDGSGNVSWVNPNNSLSVMRTNISANQGLSTAGWQKITFNSILFDSNTEFVTGTNRFVAAKAGYYRIDAGYHIFGISTTQYFGIGVFVNGTEYQESSSNHHNIGPVVRSINCIVSLNAGDFVEIYAQNYETGVTIDSFFGKTFFEVQQIK
ncbi:MAG TPA: hypothetical protein VK528_13845, partial [Flavobacterium sp.]|nr:hypothetical protein [Flavobacterium sp.]